MSVNLLQNFYVNDVPREHILLNALSDEDIKETIIKNIGVIDTKALNLKRNIKVNIVYHKLGNNGFYTICCDNLRKGGLHYYTSLNKVASICFKKKYCIKDILISHSYTLRGGEL